MRGPQASGGGGEQPARAIAFYLPQFRPIPENDEWWERGFTEWTNVARARPLFPGHHQPRLPADLGFYDLRVPAIRENQAALARHYGVEGFCYWDYWFGGRRILQETIEAVLASGKPDFPFMLGWANGSWTGIWHGSPGRVLIEQTYPGRDDHVRHFAYMLRVFRDARYIRVAGRPALYIYNPHELPDGRSVLRLWRELAADAGLPGLYIIGERRSGQPRPVGYDGLARVALPPGRYRGVGGRVQAATGLGPTVYLYARRWREMIPPDIEEPGCHPCVVPDWDNTPRSGKRGRVLHGASPDLFARQVALAVATQREKPQQERLLFIKSWNEWAESNYLEPDQRYGHGWLQALAKGLGLTDVRMDDNWYQH